MKTETLLRLISALSLSSLPAFGSGLPALGLGIQEPAKVVWAASPKAQEAGRTNLFKVKVRPERGYIGASYVPRQNALGVVGLLPGGGAVEAGLQVGDRITRIGDHKVTDEGFMDALGKLHAGNSIEVRVERGDKVLEQMVVLRTDSEIRAQPLVANGRSPEMPKAGDRKRVKLRAKRLDGEQAGGAQVGKGDDSAEGAVRWLADGEQQTLVEVQIEAEVDGKQQKQTKAKQEVGKSGDMQALAKELRALRKELASLRREVKSLRRELRQP